MSIIAAQSTGWLSRMRRDRVADARKVIAGCEALLDGRYVEQLEEWGSPVALELELMVRRRSGLRVPGAWAAWVMSAIEQQRSTADPPPIDHRRRLGGST